MYAQGKMPESIVTTETHQRVHDVTLSEPEAHDALCLAALRKVGINAADSTAKCRVSVYESDTDYDGHSEIIYSVVITEDLLKPAITDFTPPNIEEIVRLNPPTTPGLSIRLGTGVGYAEINNGNQGKSWGVVPPYTTATPSRENVDANVRMSRITKLHEVLLHGKGNNIVLNRDEVDTMLEIIERSAD